MFDPNIPHWNREAHRRTHEGLQGRRAWTTRARAEAQREYEALRDSTSLLTSFFIITGVVLIGVGAGGAFWSSGSGKKVEKPGREGSATR